SIACSVVTGCPACAGHDDGACGESPFTRTARKKPRRSGVEVCGQGQRIVPAAFSTCSRSGHRGPGLIGGIHSWKGAGAGVEISASGAAIGAGAEEVTVSASACACCWSSCEETSETLVAAAETDVAASICAGC